MPARNFWFELHMAVVAEAHELITDLLHLRLVFGFCRGQCLHADVRQHPGASLPVRSLNPACIELTGTRKGNGHAGHGHVGRIGNNGSGIYQVATLYAPLQTQLPH